MSVEKGHGRVETRELRTTTTLTLTEQWPGLAQGFEVTRTRKSKDGRSVETVYGITSLKADQADARKLLDLVRGHWQIENGLHYVRDVTLGEDRCRVRSGTARQVLAGMRNAVVHLISTVEAESRPAAIEQLSARPNQAMELIGLPHFI